MALRLDQTEAVLPAFMELAEPGLAAQVSRLVAAGCRCIHVFPYFLQSGNHLRRDIPAQLAACGKEFPDVKIALLPALADGMQLEDVTVERLAPVFFAADKALPVLGDDIEKLSHRIIDRRLIQEGLAPDVHAVYRRIIHATADFSFIQSLRVHPEAVARGVAALRAGKPVICDVRMLQAGITRTVSETVCLISDPGVMALAKSKGTTRAAAAIERLADRLAGSIVAVGNAPTALWKLLELAQAGGPQPALVVGLPVGFVGAHESKAALAASDLVYITNLSPRGGSPAAAAAVNALALLARQA
jgi:precorrin-8X/cobalt-precorrin-8 methylmutase